MGFQKTSLSSWQATRELGKQFFSTQFLYNGVVKYHEKGVYAILEEDAPTLKRNMKTFGYDLERLEEENKLRIIDIESLRGSGLSANIQYILSAVSDLKAERLVVDSITALLIACREKFDYRTLMHLFYRALKTHNCTTIMTRSIPSEQKTLGLGIGEFVADALLILDNVAKEAELKRRLLIQKMWGTNHSRKWHNVLVTKQGLEIVSFAQV